jgi:putative ABC transport system permease protein
VSWIDDRWRAIRRVVRLPATRDRLRAELDDELRFHIEGRIDELMERHGLSRDAAAREAKRRFGDVGSYRREIRSIDDTMLVRRRRIDVLDALRRETRHAARSLARTPSFSLIAVLTLALGLGAATAIFTLLDRVVLRPLPYPNADRLIHIGSLWPKTFPGVEYSISRGQYFYFRANSGVLADLMLYDEGMLAVPGDGAHPPERVSSIEVSHSTFTVLGIRPLHGRLINVEDERSRDPLVAVLSYEYWRRRFGADPTIVGRRIDFAGLSAQVVGVLSPGAHVLDDTPEIWLPNHLDPNERPINNHTHRAIGLMKPGVTVEAAAADIKRLQDRFASENPRAYFKGFVEKTGFAMHVTSLRDHVIGVTIVRALWLIFAAVGLVLIIAAANVANLFLVRIDARRREVAVRTALGAGRAHLAVYYLSESLLLALVAAAGAVAIGEGLLGVALAIAPQTLPRLAEVSLDWRSALFSIAMAAAFGVAFGLIPLASAKVDIATLRDAGRGLTTSRRRELARRMLVLSQVGLAVVLLAGAALVTKSFARLARVRPGFEPAGVVSMDVILPDMRYRTYHEAAPFWHELIRRVEALPGVVSAGATGELPLADGFGCTGIVTDVIGPDGPQGNCMPLATVTPGYFEAMGIKLHGASPTWADVEAGVGPVVVSRAFAKRFWGSTIDPVGHSVKPLSSDLPEFPVVAEAEDVRGTSLQDPVVEVAYLPMIPRGGTRYYEGDRSMSLVVRAPSVNQATLVASIRQIIAQIDPQVPIAGVESMEHVVAKSMSQRSFTMLLLLLAASIALMLSAVGIYGVISYLVGQRRAEIGIRIALGAQKTQVSRLVVGHAMRLAGAGVLIGLAGAAISMRLLESLLYDVSPSDPLSLAGAAVVLLAVALLASLGPTRRATRVDPVEAMR